MAHRQRRSARARAVVTGAGSGIGRAFALELAARGGHVICADIDPVRAAETVELINRLDRGRAEPFTCDVSRYEDIVALASHARGAFGGPTSLMINNAGVGIGGRRIGEIGVDDWHWALGINLNGMVYGTEVFLPQLRESGTGGLINVASAAAFAASPGMAAYNVGKAGVLALSETLAAELSGSDLAVTVLCPTFVKTNVAVDGRITAEAARLAQTLMRVAGFSAERVARSTLDAHDHGRLYVLPQWDAKAIWLAKRLAPRTYTAVAGILDRLLPTTTATPDDPADASRIPATEIPAGAAEFDPTKIGV